MSKHDPSRSPKHSRTLGFWTLAIYGIGDILGADIDALIGEVAAEAGTWSPVSFLVAMIVAGLTGDVSLATVTHGFDSYSRAMWPAVPDWSVWVLFLTAISLLNFWGIGSRRWQTSSSHSWKQPVWYW